MKNPWINIIGLSNKIYSDDLEQINKFNKKYGNTEFEIKTDLYPEPYIGNPLSPIILLNLNPGYSEKDYYFYNNQYARQVWEKNILHQTLKYPFYLIDPKLKELGCGYSWWIKKLKEPIDTWGIKKVANNFCCIEYFPYHSLKYKPLKSILESQKYNFYLVENAIKRNAVIILMRSKKLWFNAVHEISSYKNLHSLNSNQSVYISKNNCPTGFDAINSILV